MSPPSSVAFPFAGARAAVALDGIAHVVLEAADLERAVEFYVSVLGFAVERDAELPHCGEHRLLALAAGSRIALVRAGAAPAVPDMGRHTAYRVAEAERAAILKRLGERGVEVHAYREDRPAEVEDNCYFHDFEGNRIQLVRGAGPAIDHAAIAAVDLEWEEDLYVGVLGLPVDTVVGWRTEDYKRAARWGEGKEDMAPGTRRWDKRFAVRPGQGPTIARPNMQLFVRTGAATLGVFLAYEYYQQPPEGAIAGTPRIGFGVSRAALDAIAERLAAGNVPAAGPHEHPRTSPYRASLYARDRGGNFLEFCVAR